MAAFLEVLEGRFAAGLRRLCSIRGPLRIQLDPALVPVLPMLDSFELRGSEAVPRGWRGICQRLTIPASAGNLNIVGLANPPGSGVVAVLARLDEATPGSLLFAQGQLGAGVTLYGVAHLDSRIPFGSSPLVTFSVQQAGLIPPGLAAVAGKSYRTPFNPNAAEPLWVVGPGFAVFYASDNAGVATDTTMAGFYRSINPDDGF